MRLGRFDFPLPYLAGAGVGIFLIVAVIVLLPDEECEIFAPDIETIWNSDARSALNTAYERSKLPYAHDVATRIGDRLDAHVDAWQTLNRGRCGSDDPGAPRRTDIRACIAQHNSRLERLLGELVQANVVPVELSLAAVFRATDLDRCQNGRLLANLPPLPGNEHDRYALQKINNQLSAQEALLWLGMTTNAVAESALLGNEVRKRPFPPLQAKLFAIRGLAEVASGYLDNGHKTLDAAARFVRQARDDELAAEIFIHLAQLTLDHADTTAHDSALHSARRHIARLNEDHSLEAEFHATRGAAHARDGRPADAANDYAAAHDIALRRRSPAHARYGEALAAALLEAGDVGSAEQLAAAHLSATGNSHGPAHPRYAAALMVIADVSAVRGDFERAVEMMAQALTLLESSRPAGHPDVVRATWKLGVRQAQQGATDRAAATLQDALDSVRQESGADRAMAANILRSMARVFADSPERARASLEGALEIWRVENNAVEISMTLNALGALANQNGDHSAAASHCRQAVLTEAAISEHPLVDPALSLTCVGEALLGQGRPAEAIVPLQRAHELRNRIDIAAEQLAATRWALGRALVESSRDRQTGLAHVRYAHRVFAEMGPPAGDRRQAAGAWLKAHDS